MSKSKSDRQTFVGIRPATHLTKKDRAKKRNSKHGQRELRRQLKGE